MERYAEDPHASYTDTSLEFSGIGELQQPERVWRDRYFFLKECGYTLRPRYHPEWKPSWLGTGLPADIFEDCIMSLNSKVLDAVRTKDSYRVFIKVVDRPEEIQIARMLSAKSLSSSPNNHCVPVLDVLTDPVEPSQNLLVMPYLRPFYDPPFEVVEEVLDFIKQTLEGLAFVHSQRVAHRDCSTMNIMMDGRPLYPDDHHPQQRHLTPDTSRYARHLSRLDHPVKYYYIDWGMSSHFDEGDSPNVLGAQGADQDAPELSNVCPYNAFMLDIFILGHLYEVNFLQVYHGLDFLQPLVIAMMREQPERRPTAEAALRTFNDIRQKLTNTHLPWRLRKRAESGTERVVYDTLSAAKVGFKLVRRGLIGT
ncbi:hypothetical protein EUX98_g8621 [Antrodiella citrinella]|uniref:Protein kinase domain-containing protein n=1 Tax=Antrodiella citrinella TaxID=2447956 RepID=A0A4S4M5D7_9APHY|nr:hypothetical protein EUX98_g8621 [Antrodiella citrinella]